MSRVAPTLGTKFLYILCILFSIFLIYTDLKLKWFGGIKNFYQSIVISLFTNTGLIKFLLDSIDSISIE